MSRRIYFWLLAVFLLITAVFMAWRMGVFDVVERVPSPDKTMAAVVSEHCGADKVPIVEVVISGRLSGGSGYLHETYEGLWWSPDSSKYILAMTPVPPIRSRDSLLLGDLEGGDIWLDREVLEELQKTHLADYGFQLDRDGDAVVELSFSQWRQDSREVQLRYTFQDVQGQVHSGTLWYCLSETPIAFDIMDHYIDEIHEET